MTNSDFKSLSFGICTDGSSTERLNVVIDSIKNLRVPKFEIIIVGPSGTLDDIDAEIKDKILFLEFDEDIKRSWITKKKNLIAERASCNIIVFLHDYIVFRHDWYAKFCQALSNSMAFDVAICRISDQNGDRYTDWILHPLNYQITDLISFPNYCLLPYNLKKTRHLQYVSGAFFISTREFMKKFPFDETLVWGMGEDVEWSFRWRKQDTKYLFLDGPVVTLLKSKKTQFLPITGWRLALLKLFLIYPFKWFSKINLDARRVRRWLRLSDSMH